MRITLSVILILAVAIVPVASAAPPCQGSSVPPGMLSVWIPAPAGGSNCAGVWLVNDLGIACNHGVGEIGLTPVWVAGGRGLGCPVGAALVLA